MLSRDSRQEQKLKAILRAQQRLRQRLEMIDWENDVLLPEIEALKSGKSVLGLSDGQTFEIVVEDAHPRQTKTAAVSPTKRSRRR